MRSAAIGLMGLLVAQGAQDTQTRSPLTLEIAMRGYVQGDLARSLAGDSAPDRLQSYVWADQSLCGMGAGDQVPANTPWIGWRISGTVVSRGSDELVVDVHWQRMWERGSVVTNSQPEARTFRIRAGERVELDRAAPSNPGRCGTVHARLEAGVATRAAYLMGVPGGVASGVRGGGAVGGVATGGSGTGRGGRSGTGRGVAGTPTGSTTVQGAAAGAAPGVAFGGRGGAAGGSTTADGRGFQSYAATPFEAEIWLVHKKPDGTEHVQQHTARFGAAGVPFAFPPVQVAGSGGPITIDISGSVQTLSSTGQRYGLTQGYTAMRGRGAGPTVAAEPGAPLFGISIARRARRTTPFIDTRGATDISLQTPKPDDVLSFELPALQKSTEDLLKGHTFSLRVRIAPVK